MQNLPFPLPCQSLNNSYLKYTSKEKLSNQSPKDWDYPSKEVLSYQLLDKWLEHKVPDKFPYNSYSASEFSERCQILSDRLSPLNAIDTHEIDDAIMQDGNRVPDISEAIELAVNSELKAWQSYSIDLFKKPRELSAKPTKLKLNRNVSRIKVDKTTDQTWWSETNLLKSMKNSCNIRSLDLVYSFNNTRQIRNFVSYNFSSDPHKESQQNLTLLHAKNTTNLELIKSKPIIVTCSFYHPVRGHKMAEFDILDFQTLADLRDTFVCDEDYSLDSNKFKGSVFLIDGILYADTRYPHSLDYSKSLSNFFLESSSEKIRSNQAFSQHNTYIKDLKLPIGSRCAFLHQGDCEHRVVFTSMRLFDPTYDSIYKLSYPLRVFEPTVKMKSCESCNLTASFHLLFNSYLSPKNPLAVCKNCCELILNDEKVYQEDSNIFVLPYVEIL